MGIFSQDEEPGWSDVIHLEEQVKELKAENKRLKECNEELTSDNLNTIQEMDNERRRVEQLKQDIEAYKQSEQEAQEIIAELKYDNKQLKNTGEVLFQTNKLFIELVQDIKNIAKETIDKRPHSDNSIFENIVSLIYERTGM